MVYLLNRNYHLQRLQRGRIKGSDTEGGALALAMARRAGLDMDEIARVFSNKYGMDLITHSFKQPF